MPWDIPGRLAGFTDDSVVRFGDLPEFRGKAALEKLFRGRSKRSKAYRLRKQLCTLMGNTIANYWAGEWDDRATGAKDGPARGRDLDYALRQERGLGSSLQHRDGIVLTVSRGSRAM